MANNDGDMIVRHAGWRSRLRAAWRALAGDVFPDAPVGTPLASGRLRVHPQATYIGALIGGLPQPAIVLDRDNRVIAFNDSAAMLAPSLRPGEPALIALRMPDL